MTQILAKEEKDRLNEEFKALITIQEKLDFWNNKLPINYIIYKGHESDYSDLDWFDFQIPGHLYKWVNEWILGNYLRLSTNSTRKKKVLNFEAMVSEFNSFLKTSNDKRLAIQDELKKIDKSFKTMSTRSGGLIGGLGSVFKTNFEYNSNFESYEDFLKYKAEPDYSTLRPDVFHTINVANGVVLAKYREYVESLLEGKDEKEIVEEGKTSKDNYNVRIQHQLLHFLGFLDKINEIKTVEQKGTFLSALINRHSQRARKPFSDRSILFDKDKAEARNIKKDLLKVEQLFTDAGLTPEAKKVKEAIKKINDEHFPEDL